MFEIVFDKITLTKANKYVLLLTCANQTKRTDISPLWTSAPEFAPIPIQDVSTIQIKVCEVSHDKKLHIVGTGKIQQALINTQSNPLFSGDVKIQQLVQGKRVCVGLCNIRIIRKEQFNEITSAIDALDEKQIRSNQQLQNHEGEQQRQKQEQEQEQEQDDDQIRVQVHCGFNFYLGSAFKIVVEWGNSAFDTTSIKDKINPVWNFGQTLSGNNNKPIQLRVIDSKNNLLQNFKFQLSSLIVMFPYHIRLIFKEEFMGATPEIFISILRQSHPQYSILQLPIKFCLKNLGEPLKSGVFLMVSLSKQPKLPTFMAIDRNLIITLQQVNKYLTSKTLGEQQRVELVGLSNLQSDKTFSLLKSYLNRKLSLFVFHVDDMKKCFIQSHWPSCRLLQRKNDFEVALRKVYYSGQSFTLKKYLQIYNPIHSLAIPEQQQSATDRWKIMTNNYLLRNKLVNQSSQHIQKLKEQIQNKGRQLVELKKILKQVKLVNSSLTIKQKLMTVVKKKKIRLNAKEIDTNNLVTALIDRQTTLEQKKNTNAELALRMNCLAEIQENQEGLDEQIVSNATKLLQLQQKISKMKIMENALSRQRIIIGELQKRFQQKQIDRQINHALQEQSNKLQQIRSTKNQGLKNVYLMVREQNKKGNSLAAQVKHAEELLISLNEQYVQLKGL